MTMTDTVDMFCGYGGHRDEALVAYLYDDMTPSERAEFEAHLAVCEQCRAELAGLRSVRRQLDRWAPPEPAGLAPAMRPPSVANRSVWTRLGEIPAWARVAAALLFLGISAGIANITVHYDRNGLTVRTGWSRSPETVEPLRVVDSLTNASQAAPWRADLAALEQRLRTEFRTADAPQTLAVRAPAQGAPGSQDELLRRMRALVGDSERRQQNELALRLAGAMHDVDRQRLADLQRIGRSFYLVETDTGEVRRNQGELVKKVDYLVNVSQTKPQ
jgi:anti-sigma factor RsiW